MKLFNLKKDNEMFRIASKMLDLKENEKLPYSIAKKLVLVERDLNKVAGSLRSRQVIAHVLVEWKIKKINNKTKG